MKTKTEITRRNNRTEIIGSMYCGGIMRPVYTLSKRDDENEWIRSLATCPSGSLEEGKAILSVSLECHELLNNLPKEEFVSESQLAAAYGADPYKADNYHG